MMKPHTTSALHRRKRIRPASWWLFAVLGFALFLPWTAAQADTTYVEDSFVGGLWTSDGSPYILNGSITIAPWDTLRITEGVTVIGRAGALIYVWGHLSAVGTDQQNVVFTTDTITNPSAWKGIRVDTASCFLRYCIIEHARNLGQGEWGYGGGLYVNNGSATVEKSVIRYCRASSGSAIFARSGATVNLYQCAIRQNGYPTCYGGAIFSRSGCSINIVDSDIALNYAQYGGAAYLDGTTVTMTGCRVRKNTASVWGGGFFSTSATIILRECMVSANSSVGGGALDGRYQVWLNMDHCLIEYNLGSISGIEGNGGALTLQGGEQTITNCTFIGNVAQNGGAIYGGANWTMTNCILANHPRGGAVYVSSHGPQIRHCCFSNNLSRDFTGTLTLPSLGIVNRVNSNGDSCDAFSNIFSDPGFDDTASIRFSLAANSPCIDAGNPSSPRDPDGSVSDLGLYPYTHPADVDDWPLSLPSSVVLHPAYPNPFNPVVTLAFEVPQTGMTSLRVFDLLGREVAVLANGMLSAGKHSLHWNASDFGAGTYFAVLESSGFRATQKLLLLK